MGENDIRISTNSELFKTFDDIKLFEQSFIPELRPKGIIVILHGLTEHSGCYARVSKIFSKQRYSVHLFDLRGHGKSDGSLVFVDSFQDYLDDLSVFLEMVKKRYPKIPVFLFGQGMGGVISALNVLENRPEVRGLILSAAILDINKIIPQLSQKVFCILGRISPRWPLLKINPSDLSRNAEVVRDYENDPLVYHGKICARTYLELVKASRTLMKKCEEIKIPILILHGYEDRIAKYEDSKELHKKVGSSDKTLKLYKNFSHLLLFEPEAEKVIQDIIQWTDSHVRD